MIVRLLNSGTFDGNVTVAEDGKSLDKDCLIVYQGKFNSLDGEVEIDLPKMKKLMDNHNMVIAHMSDGQVDYKNCPPIQLDHSTSARDTVGRLVGQLKLGEYKLKDGSIVPALFSKMRILGSENVEKAKDGRWTHLSIGADLEEGKLQELSVTPFPAAPEASMLARMATKEASISYKGCRYEIWHRVPHGYYVVGIGEVASQIAKGYFDSYDEAKTHAEMEISGYLESKDSLSTNIKGDKMTFWQKLQKKVMESFKLSDKEAEEKMRQLQPNEVEKMQKEMEDEEKKMAEEKDKMRKHLMDEHKMSDKEADEKMAKMTDDEKKEMSAQMAAKDEEKKEKEKAQMASRKDNLTKLATDFRAGAEKVRLAAVKSKITVRLSGLKAQGKITPAEVKKIDLSKLAASNEATIDAVLKSYEDREPVIAAGVMGSITADDASSIAKKVKMSKLESEARMNMPSKRTKLMEEQEKMAGEEESETNIHIDTTPHVDMEAEYQAFEKMMDDGLDKERVKKYVKEMMDKCRKMGGSMDQKMSSDAEMEMSALAEEVKKMQTQLEEFVKLAEK